MESNNNKPRNRSSTGYKVGSSPTTYQMEFMPKFEEEREHIITTGRQLNILGQEEAKLNNITFKDHVNIRHSSGIDLKAAEQGIGNREQEQKTLSKGVAYQCNVINRGKRLVGYKYNNKAVLDKLKNKNHWEKIVKENTNKKKVQDIKARLEEATEAYNDALINTPIPSDIILEREDQNDIDFTGNTWKNALFKWPSEFDKEFILKPYKWNDNWKNRNEWRLCYSWCTGLPLFFDTDIFMKDYFLQHLEANNKVELKKLRDSMEKAIGTYLYYSNFDSKPQCEHKDPLYQQVYLGAGPVTPLELHNIKKDKMTKKSWSKLFATSFIKNMKKMVLEAYKKVKKSTDTTVVNKKYTEQLNTFLNDNENEIQLMFGSDIQGQSSKAPSTIFSVSSDNNQHIKKNMRTWKNFIINKYLIRGEKYAWEYKHTNQWAKSNILFMDVKFENGLLKYDYSEQTIERFINTIAYCRNGTGKFFNAPAGGGGDGIVEMWARIATNIVRLNYIKNGKLDEVKMKKNIELFRNKMVQYHNINYKISSHITKIGFLNKTQDKLSNIGFFASDIRAWLQWEENTKNSNEGIISFINCCLQGNDCLIKMEGWTNRCKSIDGNYNKLYIKKNILTQSFIANFLFNHSLNNQKMPYEIATMNIPDNKVSTLSNDQGFRNMLHFNYLRCKRLVKKYQKPQLSPADMNKLKGKARKRAEKKAKVAYNRDKFNASGMFNFLKNVNSINLDVRSTNDEWFKTNIRNPNNVQAGGDGKEAFINNTNTSLENDTNSFMAYYYDYDEEGHEGIESTIYDAIDKAIDKATKEGVDNWYEIFKENYRNKKYDYDNDYYPPKELVEKEVGKLIQTGDKSKNIELKLGDDVWETTSLISFDEDYEKDNEIKINEPNEPDLSSLKSEKPTENIDFDYNKEFFEDWCDLFLHWIHTKLSGNSSSSSSSSTETYRFDENIHSVFANKHYYGNDFKNPGIKPSKRLSDDEKNELRIKLFALTDEYKKQLNDLNQKYPNIDERIKALYEDKKYIGLLENDNKAGAEKYRVTNFSDVVDYWKDPFFTNKKTKYEYEHERINPTQCTWQTFRDIYRICAKEKHCPPAYYEKIRQNFPQLDALKKEKINKIENMEIPFIGNKRTITGLLFGWPYKDKNGDTKYKRGIKIDCLKQFHEYLLTQINNTMKNYNISAEERVEEIIKLLFLKWIVCWKSKRPIKEPKSLNINTKNKYNQYKCNIDAIDEFLKNGNPLAPVERGEAKEKIYVNILTENNEFSDLIANSEIGQTVYKNDGGTEKYKYIKSLLDNAYGKTRNKPLKYSDCLTDCTPGTQNQKKLYKKSGSESPPQNQTNNTSKNILPGHKKRNFQEAVNKVREKQRLEKKWRMAANIKAAKMKRPSSNEEVEKWKEEQRKKEEPYAKKKLVDVVNAAMKKKRSSSNNNSSSGSSGSPAKRKKPTSETNKKKRKADVPPPRAPQAQAKRKKPTSETNKKKRKADVPPPLPPGKKSKRGGTKKKRRKKKKTKKKKKRKRRKTRKRRKRRKRKTRK